MRITATINKTMRGWAINAYGDPPRILELPIPWPRKNEVLIQMHGGEVGDWDALVRAGEWKMDRPFPLVLGLAGAGTVAAVGPEVSDFAEDDRVFVYSYPLYHNGAWAEYMLAPATYVAHAPVTMSLVAAGAAPIVGLTAHETLHDILAVRRGDIVVISAAAGGVGHLAVQIAAQLKAEVVAIARRRHHAFLLALGADVAIDYTQQDTADALHARYPHGVDKILNGVSGVMANKLVRVLKDGGKMVDLTGSATVLRAGIKVDTEYLVLGSGERLKRLAEMFDQGRLILEVQAVYPFERAPEAMERIEGKQVRGKLAIEIA